MDCPHCGGNNPPEANFCRKCGGPLTAPAPSEGTPPAPPKGNGESGALTRTPAPAPDFTSTPAPDVAPDFTPDPPPDGPASAPGGKHQDPVCPFCGGTDCQPVSRTTGKARGGGYSISDGCCGMCLMGPVGLLCGLGGGRSKIDLKNEVVWVCRTCGKQHLSQKDGLEKAVALASSYGTGAVIIGLIISFGMYVYGWSWIFAALWAFSPLVVYGMVSTQVEEELGYPMAEILPPNTSIPKILILSEIGMILLLWLGGHFIFDFLDEMASQ